MSIFIKGRNKVHRRVLINDAAAAETVAVPKGAANVRIYAQNRKAVAASVSAGNVAGGAQFAAVTAVAPADAQGYTVVAPAQAGATLVYDTDDFVHITTTVAGTLDVVVEFDELLESLPLMPTNYSYDNGQQEKSAQ